MFKPRRSGPLAAPAATPHECGTGHLIRALYRLATLDSPGLAPVVGGDHCQACWTEARLVRKRAK